MVIPMGEYACSKCFKSVIFTMNGLCQECYNVGVKYYDADYYLKKIDAQLSDILKEITSINDILKQAQKCPNHK
jgi:hypothetical protein